MPRPVQKQRCAGEYPDRFLHRLVRHCGLAFFDRLAGMQQSGGLCTCAGAAHIRTHRVGVVGGVQQGFYTTSHLLRLPPPHPSVGGHSHPSLVSLSDGDVRAIRKWEFLCDEYILDTFCLFYTMQPIDTYLMLACIACCFPSAPALSEAASPYPSCLCSRIACREALEVGDAHA